VVTVQVVADPAVPSVSAAATICSGGNHTLTATNNGGGTGSCTFEWQRATNSAMTGSPTIVQTRPATTYNTGTLTGTRYYRVRRVCNGSGCNTSGWSAVRAVTVVPEPEVTILHSGDASICSGGDAGTFSSSATAGTAYQWQWDTPAAGGSATQGQWTSSAAPATTVTLSNTGFVADPSVVDVSVPTAYIGDVSLTLTSNDPFGCGAASESFVVSIVGSQAATTWTGAANNN
jgi:hypothetical protein